MSDKNLSRRDFIKYGSGALAALSAISLGGGWFDIGDGKKAMAAAEGYLVIDTKKCAGCATCMMACSLAHHGRSNPALSRIQIIQDNLTPYPNDFKLVQCRQCENAPCVTACPTGANHYDKQNGNVRIVDERKCIGCEQCVEACVNDISSIVWNFEDKHAEKCDLCLNTPYMNEKGGPGGTQTCVAVCPLRAIQFTKELPVKDGVDTYERNLRTKDWIRLAIISE